MAIKFTCSLCDVLHKNLVNHLATGGNTIKCGCGADLIFDPSDSTHYRVDCKYCIVSPRELCANTVIASRIPAKTNITTDNKILQIICPICFKKSNIMKSNSSEIQLECCYINATRSPSAYKEATKRSLK